MAMERACARERAEAHPAKVALATSRRADDDDGALDRRTSEDG